MKKQKLNKSKSFKSLLIITCLISLFAFSQCALLLPPGGGPGGGPGGNHGGGHHENHGGRP